MNEEQHQSLAETEASENPHNDRLAKRKLEEIQTNTNKRSNKRRKDAFRKYAFLMSYTGTNFSGVQIQPGNIVTVESFLLEALKNLNLIESPTAKPKQMSLSRACRTDRGVHAIRNIITCKINSEVLEGLGTTEHVRNLINEEFEKLKVIKLGPKDKQPPRRNIILQGLEPVQQFFVPKDHCKKRTYLYLLPKKVLTGNQAISNLFQSATTLNMSQEQILQRLNELLKLYEGRNSYHNFTDGGEKPGHETNFRYMVSVGLDPETPIVAIDNQEYYAVKIYGQSFMLHQIRRMIGMVIAVMLNIFPEDYITKAMQVEYTCEVPQAPAVNLMLESMDFPSYDDVGRKDLPQMSKWNAEVETRADAFKQVVFEEVVKADGEVRETGDFMFTLSLDQKKYCQFKETGLVVTESKKAMKRRLKAELEAGKNAAQSEKPQTEVKND